jgi:hypothetical protein
MLETIDVADRIEELAEELFNLAGAVYPDSRVSAKRIMKAREIVLSTQQSMYEDTRAR